MEDRKVRLISIVSSVKMPYSTIALIIKSTAEIPLMTIVIVFHLKMTGLLVWRLSSAVFLPKSLSLKSDSEDLSVSSSFLSYILVYI